MQARYCGLKQADAASTTLWQTIIAGGQHALIASADSQTFFEGCKLQDCGQDAIIAMQKSRVNLTETKVMNCGGPAIDMSDDSSAVLKMVDVVNCQGGIFLWHKSSCEVGRATLCPRLPPSQHTGCSLLTSEYIVTVLRFSC
jgi:hypothetical protein